jgi:hypothetical protein
LRGAVDAGVAGEGVDDVTEEARQIPEGLFEFGGAAGAEVGVGGAAVDPADDLHGVPSVAVSK